MSKKSVEAFCFVFSYSCEMWDKQDKLRKKKLLKRSQNLMILEILSLSRQQKMLKLRDWILRKYVLEKSPSTTEQLFVDYSGSWIKTPVVSK